MTCDISEEATLPLGFRFQDRVQTPKGVAYVIGVARGTNHLYFRLESEVKASFWSSCSSKADFQARGFVVLPVAAVDSHTPNQEGAKGVSGKFPNVGQVAHNHVTPTGFRSSALANMCPICSCKITHTKGPHWDMHVSGARHQKALRRASWAHSPQKKNDDHHLQEIQRLTQENRQLSQTVSQISIFQQECARLRREVAGLKLQQTTYLAAHRKEVQDLKNQLARMQTHQPDQRDEDLEISNELLECILGVDMNRCRRDVQKVGMDIQTFGVYSTKKRIDEFVRNAHSLQSTHEILFVYHGTNKANFPSILEEGLRVPQPGQVANGSTFGVGIYGAMEPSLALQYAKGGQEILLCAVLTKTGGDEHVKIVTEHKLLVVFNSAFILPLWRLQLGAPNNTTPQSVSYRTKA